MAELSPDELLMLQFEDRRWRHGGPTVGAIRRRLHLSPEAYRERLDRLIDRPEAMATAPLVVNRLRRQRAARGFRVGRQEKPAVLDATKPPPPEGGGGFVMSKRIEAVQDV